jgi:hypothetical protein
VPCVKSAFLILFIHGLALPLGMTKDPASGVIKQSMSAERRTLLRTLGADRSKMTRASVLDVGYYIPGSPQEHFGQRSRFGRPLRRASSTLSPSSTRLVIPEGKCNPSRNVWWKLVDTSETPHVSCRASRETAIWEEALD